MASVRAFMAVFLRIGSHSGPGSLICQVYNLDIIPAQSRTTRETAMSAVLSSALADYTSAELRSVDELDTEIGRLVRKMNTECYRMLVLVREFDDRFGWKKWSFKSCAEWLAWRCSISASAARE